MRSLSRLPHAAALLSGLLCTMAPALRAQAAAPAVRFESWAPPLRAGPAPVDTVHARSRDAGTLSLAGLGGGVVGFVGGAYLGARLWDAAAADGTHDDFGPLIYGFWGAAAGTTTLIPLGVHLANGQCGSYATALAASAAIAAGGLAVAFAADEYRLLPAIPVAQIISSTVIERKTCR